MNILVLDYEWPPLGGGGAPVAESVAVRLSRRGNELSVITMRFGGQPADEVRDGVTIRRVPCLRRRMETCETHEMLSYVISAIPVVIRHIRTRRPDIIHCHFAVPTGLLAWIVTRFLSVPYIVTCHGSDLPGHNPRRFRLAHRFTPPVLRTILRHAAAIVCPSRFLAWHLDQTVGKFDVTVIPNGVDTARWNAAPRKPASPVLLMSGRLLEAKGMHLVLNALALRDTLKGARVEVHIAGDGPMRGELERLASNMEHEVTFHGWLHHDSSELSDLYKSCNIFCLISERENAPLSLLEAMSCSMAVIAADATGSRETVGDAGLLVTPGDPEALAAALSSLINNPDRVIELGRKARQRVLEYFDAERAAEAYETLLDSVLDHHGAVR